MADRIYLMPVITDSVARPGVRVPKYYDSFRSLSLAWSMVDYGAEPACLVMAKGILDANHATIAADSEVAVIPQNLDNNVGAGNLAAVQAALEAKNIPSEWVGAGMTYRTVLRAVLFLFQFQQRVYGMMPTLTLFDPDDAITMSTQIGALPSNVRHVLRTAAESFGLVVSNLTGTDTMRDFYRTVRQQFPNVAILFGGISF